MFGLLTTPKMRPAIAKVEHTSDARVLVGIDISKHRHQVLIAAPGKTRLRRLTITKSTHDSMRPTTILRDCDLPVQISFEGQTMSWTATIIACWCIKWASLDSI